MGARRSFPLLVVIGALLVVAGVVLLRSRGWPHIPTYGLMLQPFGTPIRYQECGFHTGQDWFAPAGTPVFAIADGIVEYVGPLWLDGDGVGRGPYAIVINHGDFYSTYSHNQVALVEPGQSVRRGERIAELGAEGYARGPHLHLEIVTAPWSGDWRHPFDGCDAYRDPGLLWSPF